MYLFLFISSFVTRKNDEPDWIVKLLNFLPFFLFLPHNYQMLWNTFVKYS